MYHYNKLVACKNLGIDLIQIFQDEWDNNSHIVKEVIRAKLQKFDKIIYARKTVCREVSSADVKKFMNENHLQRS